MDEEDYEPIGSCDECGIDIYEDDSYDGLCSQCYWLIGTYDGGDSNE